MALYVLIGIYVLKQINMNIFKILSRGNGNVSETNVSSFLGFLLNPYETHGMGKLFLGEFLKKINTPQDGLKKLYSNNEISKEILSNYTIEVLIEHKLNKKRIDVLLQFNPLNLKCDSYLIGIEIKIKDAAVTKGQLGNYAELLLAEKNGDKNFTETHLVYLTNDSDDTTNEFNIFVENKENCTKNKHLYWDDISNILFKICKDDSEGNIDPLHIHTKSTIQAFNQFIQSNFTDDKDGKSMKYQIKLGNDTVIFENSFGQLVRGICKKIIMDKLKTADELNDLYGKKSNSVLIFNQVKYENYIKRIGIGIKTRRYDKDDEIIIHNNEKYYVSTEFSITSFKNFIKKIKDQKIIELDFIKLIDDNNSNHTKSK